jgi:hypothetical protein
VFSLFHPLFILLFLPKVREQKTNGDRAVEVDIIDPNKNQANIKHLV